MALVGWSPDDNQEIMTMDEMIEKFSFDRVSKTGGIFDKKKLDWVNAHYIKEKDDDELLELVKPYLIEAGLIDEAFVEPHREWLLILMNTIKEGMSTLKEAPEKAAFVFEEMPVITEENLLEILSGEQVPELIAALEEEIGAMEEVDLDSAKGLMKKIQKSTGIKGKNLFMPTRILITGMEHGPELANIIYLLGKEKILNRLEQSKKYVK